MQRQATEEAFLVFDHEAPSVVFEGFFNVSKTSKCNADGFSSSQSWLDPDTHGRDERSCGCAEAAC